MRYIQPPRNTLVSCHYYGGFDLDKFSNTTLIGDSGAYSARTQGIEITNAVLTAWAQTWYHRLAWVAAMDVSGDIPTTRANWQTLCDKGLPAVSTLHLGGDPAEMDWYVEQGVDFLGLGGIAGVSSGSAAIFRWLVQVFKYARANHPQMRFHGWGITKPDWLRLPFWSVDSSGWGASYRYGRLALRHPLTGKVLNIKLDGQDAYRPEVAMLLRDHYGVNPSDVAKSGAHNRLLMVQLSALSASVQEQQWRKMHRNSGITPPSWGRLGGWNYDTAPNQHLALSNGQHEDDAIINLNGPHRHLAEGSSEHLEVVNALVEGRELWREKALWNDEKRASENPAPAATSGDNIIFREGTA